MKIIASLYCLLLPSVLLFFVGYQQRVVDRSPTLPPVAIDRDDVADRITPQNPAPNRFPDYDPHHPAPPFELSQDYPDSYQEEKNPWDDIDFKTDPEEYMNAVLEYCLEGNIEVNFRGQENKIRKWYHAPWLHDDGVDCGNGREYHHGLTRERGTPLLEMHENQDVPLENWAIGFYNAPGGYTLGQVWRTESGDPDVTKATFPNGTVAFKLLFSDGGPSKDERLKKVPFLQGTVLWTANTYAKKPYQSFSDKVTKQRKKVCVFTTREDRELLLVQVDIAVKDPDAKSTGWVFGTFMYDASKKGKTPFHRLTPVGLVWGNDSEVTARLNDEGAFVNRALKQTWVNQDLIFDDTASYSNQAYVKYHGLGGRMNGPVDNPISSCVSCHGQAAVTNDGYPMPLGAFKYEQKNYPEEEFEKYFSDVDPGAYKRPFKDDDGIVKEYNTLDYSLQLAAGIRNYYNNKNLKTRHLFGAALVAPLDGADPARHLPEVNRGEE